MSVQLQAEKSPGKTAQHDPAAVARGVEWWRWAGAFTPTDMGVDIEGADELTTIPNSLSVVRRMVVISSRISRTEVMAQSKGEQIPFVTMSGDSGQRMFRSS